MNVRGFCTVVLICAGLSAWAEPSDDFLQNARKFTLAALVPPDPDPSNRFSGQPDAIAFGEKLFFDPGLSRSGAISCATCHVTNGVFQPNESHPAATDRRFRSVMPIVATAYQDFLFWDGRADSLWAQALAPLENPSEHDLTRTEVVNHVIAAYPNHPMIARKQSATLPQIAASPSGNADARKAWHRLPVDMQHDINHRFADIGKVIAAYVETLSPMASQWDVWVDAATDDPGKTAAIPPQVREGFVLFTGKARCAQCHAGPLFTDFDFHNTGLPARVGQPPDLGRQAGLVALRADPFNCLGPFSDAGPGDCMPLEFLNMSMERSFGAFRTPSLRGVSQRSALGHAGQVATLRQMVMHYNNAPASPLRNMTSGGRISEIVPLGLSQSEVDSLIAFLESI